MGTFVPETRPQPERAPLLGYYLTNNGARVLKGVADAWHERLHTAIKTVRDERDLGQITEWDVPIPDPLQGTLQRGWHTLDRMRLYVPDDDMPDLTPIEMQEIRADLARRQHTAAEAFTGMNETPLHIGSLVIPPHDRPYPLDQLWLPEPADMIIPGPGQVV